MRLCAGLIAADQSEQVYGRLTVVTSMRSGTSVPSETCEGGAASCLIWGVCLWHKVDDRSRLPPICETQTRCLKRSHIHCIERVHSLTYAPTTSMSDCGIPADVVKLCVHQSFYCDPSLMPTRAVR